MKTTDIAYFFGHAANWGGARRRLPFFAAALGLSLALLAPAPAVLGQKHTAGRSTNGKRPRPANLPDPAKFLAHLLDEDTSDWLEALNALRAKPEKARDVMMLAVEQNMESSNRWRIFHHIIEFGEAEDIPLLLMRVQTAKTPLEKRALEGSARALYPTAYQGEDLSLVVEVFSFAQTKPPEELKVRHVGKLKMSRNVFSQYHREGLPIGIIKRLLPLQGRAFGSREALERVMHRTLGKKRWEKHQAALLAPVQPVSQSLAQKGLLRFSMRNPLDRPLMLKVAFNAWASKFDPEVAPRYVYLAPQETKQVDLPVRLVKSDQITAARVGMRMWEVNGPFIPIFQKIYISF